MAYATVEALTRRIREDLERHFENRRKSIAQDLRHVLRLLLTTEIPDELDQLARSGGARGLSTHLKALRSHLQRQSHLPEALCARYKYKTPEARTRAWYRVSPRAWDYVHELARELNWDLVLNVPLIPYENYAWHDDLEEQFMDMEIILDSRALEGILVCALEAYLSPRLARRKGYEVYGINLGMTRDVHRKTRSDGACLTKYVSVMHSQPQLSADADSTGVVPNDRSLEAILSATSVLYPQYQTIGDFHSHPYDDFALLDEKKGWQYTPSDEVSNRELVQLLAEKGYRIWVAFIIAIARSGKKVSRSHYRGLRNTVQMSLGPCRVIVAAYRSLGSGRLTPSNTRLRLSGLAS